MRIDPTRTTLIVHAFTQDIKSRMDAFKGHVHKLVGLDDSFGLGSPVANALTTNKYQFLTSAQKQQAFSNWLQQQLDSGALGLIAGNDPDNPWVGAYITSAYKQGLVRAYLDSHRDSMVSDPTFYAKSEAAFVKQSFSSPETLDKIQSLATRTFEEMKGFTADNKQILGRTLADGMANGDAPLTIAKDMTDQIDGLTRSRANMIARTEIVRAHAEGQLDAFDALDIDSLGMMAEWATADDDAVCEDCQDGADNSPYTVDEARGLIPLHPNCRCSWIPAPVDKKGRIDRSNDSAPEADEEDDLTDNLKIKVHG